MICLPPTFHIHVAVEAVVDVIQAVASGSIVLPLPGAASVAGHLQRAGAEGHAPRRLRGHVDAGGGTCEVEARPRDARHVGELAKDAGRPFEPHQDQAKPHGWGSIKNWDAQSESGLKQWLALALCVCCLGQVLDTMR